MQFSGFQIIGFLFLFAGVGLTTVGLATTNWAEHKGAVPTRQGLWQKCSGPGPENMNDLPKNVYKGCDNKFANMFKSTKDFTQRMERLDNFEISVFSLMLIAAVVGFVALCVSPCCCNRCGGCLTFLVGTALISGMAAIAVYAYYAKAHNDHKWDFGWSYWVSLGGVVAYLLADVFLGIATARRGYSEYSHAI